MSEVTNFSFLIVAGGSGSRIGGLEKQFRVLGGLRGEEKPLWRWSVDLALRAGMGEIVLVVPVGGSIEFADRVTLHTALESRVVNK